VSFFGKSVKRKNREILDKFGNRGRRKIGKIGGSAKSADWGKSADRQNRQIGKIGGLGKIGVGSGIGRQSLDFFCRIGSRSARPIFFSEIATLKRARQDLTFTLS
jgi:hypothetical protein